MQKSSDERPEPSVSSKRMEGSSEPQTGSVSKAARERPFSLQVAVT